MEKCATKGCKIPIPTCNPGKTACCSYCKQVFTEKYNITLKQLEYWRDHLRVSYGLSIQDYEDLLEKQKNVCAICGQKETTPYRDKEKRLAVDHDKETGKVRGLLCLKCNLGLGKLQHDTEILDSAISYLEKHNA